MTKQELLELQKRGKLIVVENKVSFSEEENTVDPLRQYEGLLSNLRRIKKPISAVPAFTPRSFYDQFQFYVNGSTKRLYIYMDNTWRYVNFT